MWSNPGQFNLHTYYRLLTYSTVQAVHSSCLTYVGDVGHMVADVVSMVHWFDPQSFYVVFYGSIWLFNPYVYRRLKMGERHLFPPTVPHLLD